MNHTDSTFANTYAGRRPIIIDNDAHTESRSRLMFPLPFSEVSHVVPHGNRDCYYCGEHPRLRIKNADGTITQLRYCQHCWAARVQRAIDLDPTITAHRRVQAEREAAV